MTALAVIVPTIGRPEVAQCLSSVASQTSHEDRVLVVCDRPRRYDWVALLVEGLRKQGAQGRWTVWNRDGLGHFGHAARNECLDHLSSLEEAPRWLWSVDDDDLPTPGALDQIRDAAASGEGHWYLFRMRGGDESHYPGRIVPDLGLGVRLGNVGTPSILAPVSAKARWGLSALEMNGVAYPAGYFGDGEYGLLLKEELGDPVWVDHVVATIRPGAIVPDMLAT